MPAVEHTSKVTFSHKEIEDMLLAKAKEVVTKDGKPTNDGVEINYKGRSGLTKEDVSLNELKATFIFGGRSTPRA